MVVLCNARQKLRNGFLCTRLMKVLCSLILQTGRMPVCRLCALLHAGTGLLFHDPLLCCLQRGIDLPSLDVAYFTSLSYYMLLLFGLRGVMSLMFKEDTIDETQIQKQQMTMGMGQMGQDPQKAFEQERAALDAVSLPCPVGCITGLQSSAFCKVSGNLKQMFHQPQYTADLHVRRSMRAVIAVPDMNYALLTVVMLVAAVFQAVICADAKLIAEVHAAQAYHWCGLILLFTVSIWCR